MLNGNVVIYTLGEGSILLSILLIWTFKYPSGCNVWKQILTSLIFDRSGYWKKLFKLSKVFSSRRLRFRRDNETSWSSSNGNTFVCMELLTEFDSFSEDNLKNFLVWERQITRFNLILYHYLLQKYDYSLAKARVHKVLNAFQLYHTCILTLF